MNLPESKAERDDFLKKSGIIATKAMTMKKNMLIKGVTSAKAKCPFCDGYWHGRLAGRKNHLHLRCDGTCNTVMME
jgi:hypothetical protein